MHTQGRLGTRLVELLEVQHRLPQGRGAGGFLAELLF